MTRWGEHITFKFVSKYLEHEALWNFKSPQYKDKEMKQFAYKDLEQAMNLPGFDVNEIKSKIKNIRSTYSQELKKIKEARKSNKIYTPTLKWFNILDSSLRKVSTGQTETPISNLQDFNNSYAETLYNDQTKVAGRSFHELESNPRPKKKKCTQNNSAPSNYTQVKDNDNTEDEFDVFGKHVAFQLKTLPLILALEAQEHIHLHLNRIRREHLQPATTEEVRFNGKPEIVFQEEHIIY